MKANVEIDAGICGLRTNARVFSEDGQNVIFDIDTNCDKIVRLAQILREKGHIDAYQEISPGGPAVIMTAVKEILTGLLCRLCCTGRVIQGDAGCRWSGFAERYKHQACKERLNMADKLKVLFLCTGNSCRSQMAEGWARHLKSDVVEPHSAGIETHGLNPNAVKVMAEAGVDISGHYSKQLDELKDIDFDYVVTVCDNANESCPMFPGKTTVIHGAFDDPPRLAKEAKNEEDALNCYRRVRDEIRAFIETLPESLGSKTK